MSSFQYTDAGTPSGVSPAEHERRIVERCQDTVADAFAMGASSWRALERWVADILHETLLSLGSFHVVPTRGRDSLFFRRASTGEVWPVDLTPGSAFRNLLLAVMDQPADPHVLNAIELALARVEVTNHPRPETHRPGGGDTPSC